MATTNWTAEMIDAVLEEILKCDSRRHYEFVCSKYATLYKIGEADTLVADQRVRDGDPVNRLLWGLCMLVRPYPGQADSGSRSPRVGPLTWAEYQCIDWAVNGGSKQQKRRPDAKYMAELLQRPESVVKAAMDKIGPSRGRTGFFSSSVG